MSSGDVSSAPQPQARRKRPWWVHLFIFAISMMLAAAIGTSTLLRLWPTFVYNRFHQAVATGFGTSQAVADNTLITIPLIASPDITDVSTIVKSGNQDALYTVGWLDLSKGPQRLAIPEHGSRYVNVSLIDASTGVVIANLKEPGTTTVYHGNCQPGTTCASSTAPRLESPGQHILVIGRTFVADQTDLPAALVVARQITVTPG